MWALAFNRRLRERKLRPTDLGRVATHVYKEYVQGRLHPGLLEDAAKVPEPRLGYFSANRLVCAEIAAGRYAEALRWRARCHTTSWFGAELTQYNEQVLRINEAEALANLGRVEESLRWLAPQPMNAFILTGTAGHRAWCLATLHRVDEARAALASASVADLPRLYRCEWYFSCVAVALAAKAFTEAQALVLEADRRAIRASSKRNVRFMQGLVFAAQDQLAGAAQAFEAGAGMPYTGQGGDALLCWGDVLSRLGRGDDARRAWSLCLERDPQSPAASQARTRLEMGGNPRPPSTC